MKIIKAKNYDDMSAKAAEIFSAQIRTKPGSVLGLATGATVLGIYGKLIDLHKNGELDFSEVRTFNLDEYVGLPAGSGHSYRYYMNNNFFRHINIKAENTHLPDGLAGDLQAECARYNVLIEQLGGADIQLLGIGRNGHIGFNEPGDCFERVTHVIELDESTIKANARFFESESDVPGKAITMGIGEIMMAERIVVCVSGKRKTAILKEVLNGPVTPEVPGSILQFHKDCTLIADEEALGLATG